MRAVILAAGRGRRLGRRIPKCLLEVGGRTLLERHLEALEGFDVTVVAGYRKERVLERLPAGVDVRVNERFEEGPILSLACGLGDSDEELIVMDADVVYDPAMLHDLAREPSPMAFLLDPRSRFTGEEVMLGARGKRVLGIGRGLEGSYDLVGETVGFTRIAVVSELRRAIAQVDDPNADYEEAFKWLIRRVPAGYVIVDRPWTEIDFPEDLARARRMAREVEMHR